MSNVALLIAGGSGNRMHQDIPKQFITVNERPVIVYTLEAFENHPEIDFIYRKIIPPLKITLIYGDHPNNIEDKLACLPHKYQVVKRVKFDDPGVDLEKVINESSSVLINDVPAQVENKIIKLCFDKDVRTYVVPKIADIILKCSDSINVIDTPL